MRASAYKFPQRNGGTNPFFGRQHCRYISVTRFCSVQLRRGGGNSDAAAPATPEQPHYGQENEQPNQEGGHVLGEEQEDADNGFGGGAIPRDKGVVETCGD